MTPASVPRDATHRSVEARGATLHVQLAGPEGALPVLLLHAFPLSGRMWAPQVAALSHRYRLVAPDFRGHGRSDAGDGQYTIELLVDDLLAVLDTLALDTVVGCGLSMGGYVLLRAVERSPGRFRALVLADTRTAADDDAGKLARAATIEALKREGAAPFAERFVRRLLGPTTLSSRPDVVAEVTGIIRDNGVTGMCGALLAMAGRTDTGAVLPRVRVPTLVVVGEEDGLTPPEEARRMASSTPGAELVVIPRAGHLSSMESPDDFGRGLATFLEELERG